MAGASTRMNKHNQRKRLFKHFEQKETMPENITTAEVTCKHCGFKARYKFLRCPECNQLQE